MIFRRRPDGFSEVLRAWEGETAVCLGSGPSLTREQCDFVRGKARVAAINNAYLLAPWADLHYFGDARWLKFKTPGSDLANEDRPEFHAFAGERAAIEDDEKRPGDPRFHILRNKDHLGAKEGVLDHPGRQDEGLSDDPTAIVSGRNSGYALINVLTLAGVKRIVLLGYDYRHINGLDHFKGGAHPIVTDEISLESHMKHFRTMESPLKALGVEVVNCSPGTRLERWPRVPLDLVRWFERAAA